MKEPPVKIYRNGKLIEQTEYSVFIQSYEWKKIRQRKLKRKPWCSICGSIDNLEVHHLKYTLIPEEVRNSDLSVVCRDCHQLIHSLKRMNQLTYSNSDTHNKIFKRTVKAMRNFMTR